MRSGTNDKRIPVNGVGLVVVAALLGLWEAIVRGGVLTYQFLPPPSAIAVAGWNLVRSGQMLANSGHTLEAAVAGWAAASVAGVGLGIFLGLSRTAWRYSMASIEVMRAIPPVALVPIAFLVLGFSIRMELVIIVFVSAWPVLINTIDGVRDVPRGLREVAETLRLSRWEMVRKITLPASVPTVAVGLRLALSLSLVLAVLVEMIGNPAGLGNAVIQAQQALQPATMFAYVIAIGVLGTALNGAFLFVASHLMPPYGAAA